MRWLLTGIMKMSKMKSNVRLFCIVCMNTINLNDFDEERKMKCIISYCMFINVLLFCNPVGLNETYLCYQS